MRKRIRKDLERYKRIVRGEIRKNLKQLIESGEIVGQKGRDIVKIPLKSIRIPEFRYGRREQGGVGAGPGEIGQPIQVDERGEGPPRPGRGSGGHVPEVEIELQELAEILGEELRLPRIQPKGLRRTSRSGEEYQDVSLVGPETLLRKRQAFRAALLRQLLLEECDDRPREGQSCIVSPIREDKRYLYAAPQSRPEAAAVVVFMRDASGSMTGEKTEIIRQENYWIDLWLRGNYQQLERVYILHDYEAQEVSEEQFYNLSTGGGTRISAAYQLCDKILERRFPVADWNIYPIHFSDGENWIGDTENNCVPLLKEKLLPKSNIFCYGQVTLGRRSPGMHLVKLQELLSGDDRLITSIIAERSDILTSIKDFLGKGR